MYDELQIIDRVFKFVIQHNVRKGVNVRDL